MATMKAVEVQAQGAGFTLVDREIPRPESRQVLIRVEACGICHGDAIVLHGGYPGLSYPRIPGHEVVGRIESCGPGVSGWEPGTRVGVGWGAGPCLDCGSCRTGDYENCKNPQVTGISTDGGYAEFMVARTSALVRIPDDLSATEAAPLLCAGATTFSALKNCGAKGGEVVAVQGVGGLGHLGIQYAAKLGFRTVALSRGKDKEKLALGLGAQFYIDTSGTDPGKELQNLGGARVILCTAPDAKSIAGLVDGLGNDGQIIIVAGVNEPLQIYPGKLFRGGLSIKGWHGQKPGEAVDFSVQTGVHPMIEVFPLEKVEEAFGRMLSAKVRFRAVLKISG